MPLRIKATAMNQPLSLIIEPAGAHRFAYTKVEAHSGEAVWRWPQEQPLRETTRAIEARGQLLDISA
jgi:hypothetical protein